MQETSQINGKYSSHVVMYFDWNAEDLSWKPLLFRIIRRIIFGVTHLAGVDKYRENIVRFLKPFSQIDVRTYF